MTDNPAVVPPTPLQQQALDRARSLGLDVEWTGSLTAMLHESSLIVRHPRLRTTRLVLPALRAVGHGNVPGGSWTTSVYLLGPRRGADGDIRRVRITPAQMLTLLDKFADVCAGAR